METHAWYHASWEKCLVLCLMGKNAWYHVSRKHMLGIVVLWHKNYGLVSCVLEKMLGVMFHWKSMLVIMSHGKKMVDVSHGKTCLVSCIMGGENAVYRVSWKKTCCVSCLMERHAWYLVSWKKCFVSCLVETNSWYPVLWKIMLGSWSHEMICIMSGGNPSLVSCLIKKMLGIMSHGNTCLVS